MSPDLSERMQAPTRKSAIHLPAPFISLCIAAAAMAQIQTRPTKSLASLLEQPRRRLSCFETPPVAAPQHEGLLQPL
jgi:hypothetical protein